MYLFTRDGTSHKKPGMERRMADRRCSLFICLILNTLGLRSPRSYLLHTKPAVVKWQHFNTTVNWLALKRKHRSVSPSLTVSMRFIQNISDGFNVTQSFKRMMLNALQFLNSDSLKYSRAEKKKGLRAGYIFPLSSGTPWKKQIYINFTHGLRMTLCFLPFPQPPLKAVQNK